MGKKGNNYFWVSYTDLMTSLFFIMLVLYVLTFYKLTVEQEGIRVLAAKYQQLQNIERAVNEIDTTGEYFIYKPEYKKHVLNIDVRFRTNSSNINDLPYIQKKKLNQAGRRIINLIKSFNPAQNVKYLVIIEGQASKDNWVGNNVLSYERAIALHRYWKRNDIRLDELTNCELILSGSGEGGVPRAKPDRPPNNQRFLIHIIPKIGEL